jgi:hypothetical protein
MFRKGTNLKKLKFSKQAFYHRKISKIATFARLKQNI